MGSRDTQRVVSGRLRAALLLVVLFAALWVIFAVVVSATVLRSFDVQGNSMSPTLQHGERVTAFLPGVPGRQDIVILDAPPRARSPHSPGFIKRVVAVGGDTVSCCSGGHLEVNGAVVREPYAEPSQPSIARVRVPRGDVFVLGDNRMNSEDSRSWGPVPADLVVGTVVARGPAAIALSPIAVGALVALVITLALWIFWIRRTALWRDAAKSSEPPDDRPGDTERT